MATSRVEATAGTSLDATDTVAARATGLTKTYGRGATTVHALDGVDIEIARGRFTAIMGPSGSGKSTLMHCLAGLDTPTSGSVVVSGRELSTLGDTELTRFRRDRIGFVFQSFNLLPMLTARANILLPMDLASARVDPAWFDLLVDVLSLHDRLDHRPGELSGGQQQRVALARGLIARPTIMFADEPTGNLDSRSSAEVLGLLRRCVRELGQTVVMVTHDHASAAYADDLVVLEDGRVVSSGPVAR
jgi:putative ABC transport system ATP-binding protein